ncbi:MAG TPA: hypothetical protein VIA06_20260 [Candidatus Dormibacteraeota bacterium]|jgi:hypothetical protein|nr:hypothetical protein [Candidatus Dormibacteraeota bacterium]
MRAIITVCQMLFRLFWLVNIVLGILFWTGHVTGLVPLHILLGIILTLLLVILALLAGIRGKPGLLVVGVIVAILLPVVGLNQQSWDQGSGHWIIQVLHLLVGILAIVTAEAIGGRIKRLSKARA